MRIQKVTGDFPTKKSLEARIGRQFSPAYFCDVSVNTGFDASKSQRLPARLAKAPPEAPLSPTQNENHAPESPPVRDQFQDGTQKIEKPAEATKQPKGMFDERD